ncbi:hypothetical protein KKH39_03775 [Patescibacteria group bacterium]|nr:hypothetical protein [Patescibacteria group bacterium]
MAHLDYSGTVCIDPVAFQATITLNNISAEGLVLFLAKRGWQVAWHDLDYDCQVECPRVVVSINPRYPHLQAKLEEMLADFIGLNTSL